MEEIFEDIYLRLKEISEKTIKELRNKKNKIIITILIFLVVINLFLFFYPNTKGYSSLSILFSIFLMIMYLILINGFYRNSYKEIIIKNLVKCYHDKIYYDAKSGIVTSDYIASGYDKNFNVYRSEDRIYGKFDEESDFQIAEVKAQKVYSSYRQHGKSHKEIYDTFSGLFGVIRLQKNIMAKIDLESDSIIRKYEKNRIEVDSVEFEKNFDLLSDNKILALKIFTSDLIETFNDFKNEFKGNKFELKIKNNRIYFRLSYSGNAFEPPILGSDLDKSLIRKYFRLIYYPYELSKKLVEKIDEVIENKD